MICSAYCVGPRHTVCGLRPLVPVVAVHGPTGTRRPGEQLEVWSGNKALDASVGFGRLAGVFAPRRDDGLLNVGIEPLRCATCSEQANLGVCPRPITETHGRLYRTAVRIGLQPHECASLVF